ncbi:hypothetical protein GUITHDRAFT_115689 [Guillardia theta CCMP2712]|uniref:RecQ-mediated genome instability protein 1 n=1 Tax=Guillardia theta (strain CCMP2712) TaxID=905079 RepID=L1IPC1_GUITC|nr:hypothetical protein GUITHDRAFT_115689 [Guillardia theta CCMP2712]EKX38136.1 hypothetical protein GUITHDRAFT_115689 [Guillardia theta CCMP2712]|eukprot:XP_005825116.1 hypothetical protein GUITHDRAFT_115689 [Guillardia theta CCMP2712]
MLYDSDLKRFGSGSLPEAVNRMDGESVKGPIVVQLTKCVNVSEPSHSQHAASRNTLLLYSFTDGKRECVALQMEPIKGLGLETPPGTKLKIHNVNVKSGVLLLGSGCCTVLGGVVQSLKEEWETSKKYGNSARKMMIQDAAKKAQSEDFEPPPKFESLDAGRNRQQESRNNASANAPRKESAKTKNANDAPSNTPRQKSGQEHKGQVEARIPPSNSAGQQKGGRAGKEQPEPINAPSTAGGQPKGGRPGRQEVDQTPSNEAAGGLNLNLKELRDSQPPRQAEFDEEERVRAAEARLQAMTLNSSKSGAVQPLVAAQNNQQGIMESLKKLQAAEEGATEGDEAVEEEGGGINHE